MQTDFGTARTPHGLEVKFLPFDGQAQAAESGVVQGYASLFGEADQGGDVVAPGAFRASLARLAAADAGASGRDVRVLSGGTAAWVDAGHPMAKGFKDALDEPKVVWVRPYDQGEGNEEAMKAYLGWEVDLTQQIERDGTANFLDFGAAGEGGAP